MFRKISASVACCVSLFAVAGCDVGLGESVDTSAPTLSIEYPPIAAVIKDTFVLYGSCDDDKNVASVSVQVVNTETKEVVDTLNATIDAGGKSWRVDVNPYIEETGKYKYLDGTYQFSVSAVDGAGHSSGESSRTFDLDNTAPVFIISKPGVRKGENKSASKYGSVFTIDGTIADDHTIAVMDVKIFSSTTGELLSAETYDGEQLESFREEEIATAGGTSVTIAQYGSGTRYSQLHPNDSGTETYYAEISLSDNAETYNNPAESDRSAAESKADSIGNSTSKLYLYDDVYTSLMSAKKGLGLSAADLKNILNGTVSNDEALAKLAESETDTSADTDSKLLFSLNPESNPTYTVSGYGFDFSGNGTIQSASSGNTVNFTLNSGLDGVKVDPSTLKVWIKRYESKPTDESSIKEDIASLVGKVGPLDANAKSDGEKTISDEDKQRISDEDGWTCIFDYCDYTGSSVDVESVAITLPTNIKINKYYILAATGYDVDDVAFSHNTVYGFAGNEQGIAPTIEFTSPENAAFVNASDFSFVGTAVVNSESLFVKKLVGTVTAASGSNSNIGSREITLSRMTVAEDMACDDSELGEAFAFDRTTGIWTFTPSRIPNFVSETGAATKYTLSLFAESSSGHNITMSTMVQLDTTKPVVTITTVTPTVSGADFDGSNNVYINGTVRIMGSIVEQNLEEVTYDIRVSNDLTADLSDSRYSVLDRLYEATKNNQNIPAPYDGKLGTSNSIDVYFMTSMVTSGYHNSNPGSDLDTPLKIRVIITAKDKVGNIGTYSSADYNGGKDFIIYQETDRPQISFTNASEDVDSESKINVDTNLFLTTSNKLSVTFTDDDGIESYKITVKDSAGNELDGYSKTETPNKSFTSGSRSLTLPETVGIYKVQIEATDVNYKKTGLESSAPYGSIASKEFYVAIDNGAPTVTADSVAAYVSSTDSVTGSIAPSSKDFDNGTTLSAKFLDSELSEISPQPATLVPSTNGSGWTIPLSPLSSIGSGSFILRITAADKYGQTGSTTVKFGIDSVKPTIDATNFTAQTVKLDESNFVTLKANASDETGGSGIASFGYCLSENNMVPTSYDSAEWKSLNQTNDGWNVTFDVSQTKNDDGTLYAFLAAKDNAGNTTIYNGSAKLTIDKAAPTSTVTITSATDGKVLNQSKTELSGSEAEFGKIYYSSKAFTLGGEIIETNLDVSEENKPKLTVKKDGGSETALNFTTGGTAAGEWTYEMPADSADGSYEYTLTVKDKVGSEFSKSVTVNLDTKAPTVDFTSPADGENFESAPSAKIVYSDDGVGIDTSKVTYTITDASGNAVASSAYSVLNGGATGAVTFSSDFDTEGSFKISASVEDYFGNKATTEPRSFYFDKAKPSVSESEVGSSGITTNSGFALGGTVSDTNGLKSLVISDGNDKIWSVDVSGKESNWTKDFVVGNSNSAKENYLADGSYSFAIVATDVAGKTTQISRSIKIDTVAPTFGNDSPSDSNTTNVIPHVATSSVEVDGTTWYKTNDLKIAGTASDGDGTGISEVYFETSDDGNSWGGKTDLAGTKSWSGTVSGVESGKTRIRVTVVDNAGNSQTSTVLGPFSIDTKEPELTEGSVKIGSSSENASSATSYLSNGKSDIFVSFEVTDETGGSGIESVYVLPYEKISAATKVEANKAILENGKASFTIGKENIKKSGTVYARIFDKAGNYTDSNVFAITFDNTAPTVTLNNPSDADSSTTDIEINGTIELSGTVKDENTLPDNGEDDASNTVTAIRYAQVASSSASAPANDASSWTNIERLSITGNYTFNAAGFDTTGITDEKYYYIQAVAVDKAGNTGYSEAKLVKVVQDSDRPQVKINNLNAKSDGTYILKYGTNAQVTGTITDDDSTSSAVISKLIISETAYTGTGDEPTNLVSSYTASTGDFTFTPSDTKDGSKTFYIYIEDNAGGKFYTTATTENNLSNPKISVKGTAAAESVNSAAFTYSSDGTNPVVNLAEGLPYATETSEVALDDKNVAFALTTADKQTTNATLNSSFKVGGTSRRYVKFYFTASDASGVAGMTVVFKNESGNVLKRLATALTIGDVTLSEDEYAVSGSFTATTDSTAAAWTTDFIDLSGFGTGQISVAVTPYDNAGLSGNGASSFNVDNTAPTIEIRSPSSGTEVTGSVSISGTANDTGAAGTSNIQWIVPTTTQTTTFNAKTSDAEKLAYLQSLSWNGGEKSLADGATLISWQFDFDGQYDTATSDSDNFVFSAGNPLFNVYDKADFATNDDYASTGLYYLPVYFLATDALGNASYSTGFYIKHNPDADRPKLEFTYPTKDNYKNDSEQYAVLGGTIRATGSAEIPSGTTTVGAIYYQIADEDGAFDSDDMAQAEKAITEDGYGYTVVRAWDAINAVKGTSFTSSTTLTDQQLEDFGFASNEAFQAWWGVKANGTASWNLVLNSSGELNPSDTSSTKNITLRACGINADGKVGAWTSGDNVIAIHVDNTAPVISGVINQYSNGTAALTAVPTTEYTSSQTYEADMYLRGYWTLVATVVDETEVKTYSVLKGSTALTEGSGYFVESGVTDSSTGKKGYRLYIPIPKDSGSVEITINASDNEHDSSLTYSFNIDETAPTLEKLTGNGTSFESDDFESIEDDNYQFIVAGSSTDEGSGVENILFYYMRKNGTTGTITDEVVMDPMITSSTDDAKVAMSDLTERTFAQGSDEFTLYAKEYTGTATTETFTSDSAYDAHVRIGGVVEIDGILHTISAISGNTVTFSPSLSAAKTSFTAYFPIAQVIDNSATEKVKSYSANPFTFEKGDDGDKMPESFSKSGKTWTWDATIHSTNMPDGPASLVILAFDSAGNVAGKTINTKITNNAPRLAKVFLGTDLSGDGKYVNSSSLTEIVEYDILGAEGATQKTYTLDFTEKQSDGTTAKYSAGTFKIKNGLAVIPELTGGNGDIGMVLSTSATSATAVTGTVTNATSSSSESADSDGNISASFTGTVAGEFKGSNASYKMHAFTVASGALGSDGTNKGMSFTFWDSTEETTQGTDSQYSVLYVKNFTVAQSDTTKPTVVVNPFYWNASDDNSLYSKSSDNGHIELEADLTDSIKTAYGSDPKVSGKITFTGTAYDEHKLSSLAVKFGTFLSTATSVATYDSANSSWTVASKTMDPDGYEFTVTDATSSEVGNYGDSVYFDQKGHKVYWTLSIDTSKITTVAATDVKVTVTATDASGNATDTSSITAPVTTSGYVVTDGTTNYPVYQMDVVPYVTDVTTSLTSLKKKNPSVYNRSTLGHYPVRSDETVTFSGFNLGTNTSLDISTLTTSGSYDLTVNDVKALNNSNDNNARGSYETEITDASSYDVKNKYAYNRQPNNDNNNLLTDDIYFDVWEFNSAAAIPISGKIEQPHMAINPKTGQIGFAFVNGPLYFSMAGSTENNKTTSYDYWMGSFDFFTSVAFTYDSLGYSYGTAAGGDINSASADKFQLITSRWGRASRAQSGSYSSSNSLRLESIGQKGDSAGNNTGTRNFDKQRIKSPSLATTVHDNSTNLYLAYYDAMNDEIRFKAGSTNSTAKTNFGSFTDYDTAGDPYVYRHATVSMIAGSETGRNAGSYVSIAAIPGTTTANDVVVVVWYDETERKLKYGYNTTPQTDRNGQTSGTEWTVNTIFSGDYENAGEYCQIAVDANGGVHIAAYDSSNCDLVYAYLPAYNGSASTCVVDANGVVGSNITLDVALNASGIAVPRIGYYATSCIRPKLAYLYDTSSAAPDGSEDDAFTGKWECSVVPTASSVSTQSNQYNKMNVGIWKDSDGKVTTSTTGTSSTSNTPNGYSSTSYGFVYGNGTANAVMGYAIKVNSSTDAIETAQMR